MPSATSYCGRQASRAHRAIDVGVGTPNRLAAVEQYAREGGGLLMIGGYLSFARDRRQGPLPRDLGRAALPRCWRTAEPIRCLPWASHGVGRSAAFASDCASHWCPPGFMDWPGSNPPWGNLLRCLAGQR